MIFVIPITKWTLTFQLKVNGVQCFCFFVFFLVFLINFFKDIVANAEEPVTINFQEINIGSIDDLQILCIDEAFNEIETEVTLSSNFGLCVKFTPLV